MRKILVLVLALGLVAGALSVPASAKKKKKPKAVATTLYLHGDAPIGEGLQGILNITDGLVMSLDENEPTEQLPKSYNFNMPVGNDQCSGNSTFFPTWVGDLQGKIVGDATWTVHFVSPPSRVIARIWTDTPISSCNDSYIEPAQEVLVELPAGQNEVEIIFEDLNLPAHATIMLELLQRGATAQGRVLYDAEGFESRIEFGCIPARGKSCTP